ncbi:hypothetical protein POX_a01835 [Penicillium oxalicum]|uniref:hypothetical protein n=1 Tax=Penicillium oxalicum TaxID=69781 RepID=UPI0020B774FD|nr:hypothetical protein POX_a01835 [Penicillium oxalicum]KAI2795230.1 hypothetical protein POX_a01835 [Penicillium oxalicum]
MEEMKNDAIEILSDDSSVEGKTDFLANEEPDIATSTESCAQHPFQKWMESFRANRRVPQTVREREVIGWYENDRLDLVSLAQNDQLLEARRNSTASDRSSQLGTVRTWSLAVTSVSCGASRGRAQSNAGLSMVSSTRNSAESSRPTSNPGVDENAAETRATDRRRILRELLTTEVDYVIGLKALIQVVSFFEFRPQLSQCIEEICLVHERFLRQLQAITPMSSPEPDVSSSLASRGLAKRFSSINLSSLKRMRSRSLRAMNFKAIVTQRVRAAKAEPSEALEVARALDNMSRSFVVYQNFCRNYDVFTQDLEILQRSLPDWPSVDNGIEALSKSVASINRRKQEDKKSMTFSDLMIKKPIQRICRYPLLLQDLLKEITIGDCRFSHYEIGNPVTRDRIRKTILLQEKLECPESSTLQDVFKDLGPMHLCGVLFVTYQTPGQITGSFMVCVLFPCHFLVAKQIEGKRLEVLACVYLLDLKEEAVQNGQGLACYGCLFSWKFQFLMDGEHYEFVLSASSAAEEKVWQTETLKCSAALTEMRPLRAAWNFRQYSSLNLPLVSLHYIQYQVSSLSRRSSMDSVAIARKARVQSVVIKKTHFPNLTEDTVEASPEGEIERPKTTVPRGAVIVTAKRGDRVRLERLISEFCTTDVLPSPGMIVTRSDQFRRRSIMRHLTLSTAFGRRGTSKDVSSQEEYLFGDARPVEYSSGEEKILLAATVDGADDPRCSADAACESPQTPTSAGEQRAIRSQVSTGEMFNSICWEPSEHGNHPEASTPGSPSRKKWFDSLSPRRLMRSRPSLNFED